VNLKAKPEQVGKQFRCPKCGTKVTVPAVDDTDAGVSEALSAAQTGAAEQGQSDEEGGNVAKHELLFRCPHCRATLRGEPDWAGTRVRCPKCSTEMVVPSPKTATPETRRESSGTDTRPGKADSSARQVRQPAAPPETPPKRPSSAVEAESPVPDEETAAWEPGQTILDDYEVQSHLGRGGMGDVYLVRSQSTGERFAVKRVLPELLRKVSNRRAFLRELRTWIDLPEHPNLTACRFFRTVEDETLLFAEYVAGGSLQKWISEGRLSELEQILDVAIQFAWGLEVAHQCGLVHQDVKPLNVLMTPEGVPKVTDFGLAKTRMVVEASQISQLQIDLLHEVTGAAGTREYCSPEQAERERLSDKTDIWSWGLSLLAMFIGKRTWLSGVAGPEVLETRCKAAAAGDKTAFRVPMPAAVREVLRRCFQRDPAARWSSIGEAADAAAAAYGRSLGRPYSRQRPANVVASPTTVEHDRRFGDITWTDPQEWLREALEAAGREPGEADRLVRRGSGTRQAQAIDDLIAYEEAQQIFSRLVASGRTEYEDDLATLCVEKAFVHGSAGDLPGALDMYDRAIEIYERLLHEEGRRELASDLAVCYNNKAEALRDLGDNRGAVALYNRAIELYERLVHEEGRHELVKQLAVCYHNQGWSLFCLGTNSSWGRRSHMSDALDACDRAVQSTHALSTRNTAWSWLVIWHGHESSGR